MVNNQITADYASQPVVIIGYDNPSGVASMRKTRYYAADPTSPVTLPHMMVDSGRKTSRGGTTDKTYWDQTIHSMIDSELGRPPQAEISAQYKRMGNKVEFTVKVTNQSGVTLSSRANKATVHAVVYETFTNATRPSYALVNNFGRATAYKSIATPLANDATGSYTLTTPDLPSDVKWENLHMLAMVDYLPGGSSGAYDMLQAAFATDASGPSYSIEPNSLAYEFTPQSAANETKKIQITSSSATMTWSATASASWMTVNPPSGAVGTPLSVTVSAGSLSPGFQNGKITIRLADTGGFSETAEVPVVAYLGKIFLYLPNLRK